MSETADVIDKHEEKLSEAEAIAEKKVSPPHDLPLSLDLYNFDSPDAQSCPYVLTSPRSLEACSRVGIKPVDLLQKSFEEFSGDLEPGKPLDELCKLYDTQEKHRIILLEKCQAERDFIIWRTTCKQRSQSLSPCRRNKQSGSQNPKDDTCTSVHPRNVIRKSREDILSAPQNQEGRPSRLSGRRSRSSSVKNRNPRPISWSTPASPYFRGSSNLFVRITSPVVCAKLQSFPRNKMRLPPKEMKILEVILQKYEKQEEEEQRRAKAMWLWDKEKEDREKRKERAEMQRWKNLAIKQKRSCSEERFSFERDRGEEECAANECCARHIGSPQEETVSYHLTPQQKRRSFKNPRNQKDAQSFEENRFTRFGGSERLSRYDAEQKLKAIRLKEEQFEKRKKQIIHKRDSELKRSAEELREKIKHVKSNQQELDKAMDKWREQIVVYQYASNVRAAEKVAEIFEQKKLKIKQDRLSRQAEHKKKMQKIEAEDFAKLQDMMAKLRSKDERSKAFVQEKHSSMEQSRQLAQAASDLRDLIRQRLDKDSFLKRSQQAFLDSRLQRLEPRASRAAKKENKPSDN